ncbi:MAG: SDR family oxidoreductase [Rhodospirillales bacterium]|nr:SDR family oxidoreductase [Rhodospirillales bacterium]MDE2198183.1 SDR family oxidoreductase [Rhodospirillales bacterium]MDE2573801.1 SDR family oxidoreductase [Rhodospirillales bacterium]
MAERVILVTGAASGIGAALCRRLAGAGVAILAHTRANAPGVEASAQAVRDAGGRAATLLGDLALAGAPEAAIAETVARFGRLDVLVSNAGFADRTPLPDLTDSGFARAQDAIALAFLRLARAAVPHLRAAGHGRVVAVSSFVAHSFRPDVTRFAASAAAKAGLEALVRALAIELAPDGVTVNAVVPGFIRKDPGTHVATDPATRARHLAAIPLARQGLPEEVAAAIAFLASPEAGYITGQALHVDGGLVM